jgi:hypothetical protein
MYKRRSRKRGLSIEYVRLEGLERACWSPETGPKPLIYVWRHSICVILLNVSRLLKPQVPLLAAVSKGTHARTHAREEMEEAVMQRTDDAFGCLAVFSCRV